MRKFVINVNGNSYEVEVEEVGVESKSAPQVSSAPKTVSAPKTAPAPKVAPKVETKKEVVASGGQETIEAPMPGNIWKLMVKEGDTVKEGDVLLILEAMKMENEILAPRAGKVVAISTTEGSTVSGGDRLIILE